MTGREIPLHILSLLQHNGQGDPPNKKKKQLGEKSLGGRTVGFALLIPDFNWPQIETQQGRAEFPAWGSHTLSIQPFSNASTSHPTPSSRLSLEFPLGFWEA